jgi:hypothetical protein
MKVFPVAEINYTDHLFYSYSPSDTKYNLDNPLGYGWVQLLSDLTALHNMEDPSGSKNYYGLVNSYGAHECGSGCITGIGYLGGHGAYQTAAGWSGWGAGTDTASETLVHELGHNFGRGHVQCNGRESNPDMNYPYPGGRIGQYGLDLASGVLYNPSLYADFMSYCDPAWISDYTYWNIYQYRSTSVELQESSSAWQGEAIFVGGVIDPNGEITLRPVYRQKALIPGQPEGSHILELLDSDGLMVGQYAFTPVEIPDAPGFLAFNFFVPDTAGLSGLRIQANGQVLAEKRVPDLLQLDNPHTMTLGRETATGGETLRWSPAAHPSGQVFYRVRISRDGGESWQVLALDLVEPYLPVPADTGFEQEEAWLEIQASDGIHTSTQLFKVERSR